MTDETFRVYTMRMRIFVLSVFSLFLFFLISCTPGKTGQYLIIDPDLEIVVVFASELLENDFFLPYKLFTDFIVPVFSKVN